MGACEDLEGAVSQIFTDWRNAGESPDIKILAITGDLTVCGDDSEFAMALTFAKGEIGTNGIRASASARSLSTQSLPYRATTIIGEGRSFRRPSRPAVSRRFTERTSRKEPGS